MTEEQERESRMFGSESLRGTLHPLHSHESLGKRERASGILGGLGTKPKVSATRATYSLVGSPGRPKVFTSRNTPRDGAEIVMPRPPRLGNAWRSGHCPSVRGCDWPRCLQGLMSVYRQATGEPTKPSHHLSLLQCTLYLLRTRRSVLRECERVCACSLVLCRRR